MANPLENIEDYQDLIEFVEDYPHIAKELMGEIFANKEEFERIFTFPKDYVQTLKYLPPEVSAEAFQSLLENQERFKKLFSDIESFNMAMAGLSKQNQRVLMDYVLANENIFNHFFKNVSDFIYGMQNLRGDYSNQLKHFVLDDVERFHHYVKNVDNLFKIVNSLPQLAQEVLDKFYTPQEFSRLIPSMFELTTFTKHLSQPLSKDQLDTLMNYIFNQPSEFNRLFKRNDDWVTGIKEFPKLYSDKLMQKVLNPEGFKKLIPDYHDLINTVKRLPHESAKEILVYALNKDFERLFGDNQLPMKFAIGFMPAFGEIITTYYVMQNQSLKQALNHAIVTKNVESIEIIKEEITKRIHNKTIKSDVLQHLVTTIIKEQALMQQNEEEFGVTPAPESWKQTLQTFLDFTSTSLDTLLSKHLAQQGVFQLPQDLAENPDLSGKKNEHSPRKH